jgi:ribosomal protein S18 acetylase RimI-like enzyme
MTIDKLLGPRRPLPAPGSDETLLTVPGGQGLASRISTNLDEFVALFTAADAYQLQARVTGPDAMAALLQAWDDRLRATAKVGDDDSAATLTWPSRDVAMTRVLLANGFVPGSVLAVRRAGNALPSAGTDVHVRQLTTADIGAAISLWQEANAWDAQFGMAYRRSAAIKLVRAELEKSGALVAEIGGQVRGLVVTQDPQRASWVAPMIADGPVAYITCLSVTAACRGRGVGAALVDQVHAELDRAGITVSALHYAALNPLSVPFWHRCGYRPLRTSWVRRPVVRAGREPMKR